MTNCPYCKMTIDSDSFYCDQCGEQLYICPKCHIYGKGEGKHCGLCGQKLVPALSQKDNASQESEQCSSSPNPNTDSHDAFFIQHSSTSIPTVVPTAPSCLKCYNENVTIQLFDNAIIGRTTGNYASVLNNLIYISSKHDQLHKTDSGWEITDLNSRNGTKVNNVKCAPTLCFKIGDIIKIANTYDFIVE